MLQKGQGMNRNTRMAGLRLGLTYGAALVLLGLCIAALAVPSAAVAPQGEGAASRQRAP